MSRVEGLPFNITSPVTNATRPQCLNDNTIQILQENLESAEAFCGGYANYVKPTPAVRITKTAVNLSTPDAGGHSDLIRRRRTGSVQPR